MQPIAGKPTPTDYADRLRILSSARQRSSMGWEIAYRVDAAPLSNSENRFLFDKRTNSFPVNCAPLSR
ncbi:hypothetical protein D3C81_640970 [compost metagenome]